MKETAVVQEKKTRGRKATKLRELSISEKEKIYQQHMGLVVSIAKRYVGKSRHLTFEDLIGEGILGLFRAAEKFDEQKGYRFSTYAYYWIRQFIKRALIDQERTIHIPSHIIEALNKYRKAREKLFQELGREPLIEEIAADAGITVFRTQQIKKFLEKPTKFISLNAWLKEDEKEVSPVILASRSFLREDLEKILKKELGLREERIIKLKFDWEDGVEHTLREISEEIGLSKEGIRQIIKRTLKRLKESGVFKEEFLKKP